MHKGTPKFEAAWARVQEAENPALAFRDEMIKLGHSERVLNLYRVKDKATAGAVWFVPNKSQKSYLEGREGRNIILKCRQVGNNIVDGNYNIAIGSNALTQGPSVSNQMVIGSDSAPITHIVLGHGGQNTTTNNLLLQHSPNGVADSSNATNFTVTASDKIAGSGNGGNLLLRGGTSVGGAAGKVLMQGAMGVGNSAAATAPGTVTNKIEIFDATGASLGFIAVYDAIT